MNDQAIRRLAIDNELNEIHAEYACHLNSADADQTGAIYARYSTRFQDSVTDQVRSILQEAVHLRIWVAREHIFFDAGVSGTKARRPGMSALDDVLRNRKVQAVLLFATNRLFRKTYRMLEFFERVTKSWRIRCVFTHSGIDSADAASCQMLLHIRAITDEAVVQANVAHIRSAHQGLLERGLVCGTETYGFGGEAVEGEKTSRGLDRRRIIIDSEAAAVVRRIFAEFNDGVSIADIVRRLNDDPSIPPPPRCKESGRWSRPVVDRILANERYIGVWKYGETEATYDPEGDYTRQYRRPVPLLEVELKHLRIVDDRTFLDAQRRLQEDNKNYGPPPGNGGRRSHPQTLNGFVFCPVHDAPLAVSGAYGKSMICLRCRDLPAEKRAVFTELNRALALGLICQAICDAIAADDDLVDKVIAAIERQAEAERLPDKKRIKAVRERIEQIRCSIDFTCKNVGATENDQRESERLLRQLRTERLEKQAELDRMGAANKHQIKVPSRKEVRALLQKFASQLSEARGTLEADDAAALREVIRRVTGGRIVVEQCGKKARHQGWLRGRFRLQLVAAVASMLCDRSLDGAPDREVCVDFRRPNPLDEQAEQAWKLDQQGRLRVDIARELGCSKSTVTKLLKHAAEMYGEEYLDGRKRRSSLDKKQMISPKHVQIADEVFRLWHETDMLATDMGAKLNVDRDTITRAIQYAHEARGLARPDGRSRRKRLQVKSRPTDQSQDAA